MSKFKLVSIMLAFAMILGLLSACGSSSKLIDGVYKVEFSDFDSHGYKPQLELTVLEGKITAVKYDELFKDGGYKSQDESYRSKMEEGSKTYPEKAFKELEQQLITKQSSKIDTVAGATASSTTFQKLVKYAIDDMAKKGSTSPSKIPVK